MRICGILVASLLMGCASTSSQKLSAQAYPPRDVDCELEVYFSESRVEKKFKEIALVVYRTREDLFSDKGPNKIVPALKKEACKLGADGLVIRGIEQGSWGHPGHGEAVAIKFLTPSLSEPQTPRINHL